MGEKETQSAKSKTYKSFMASLSKKISEPWFEYPPNSVVMFELLASWMKKFSLKSYRWTCLVIVSGTKVYVLIFSVYILQEFVNFLELLLTRIKFQGVKIHIKIHVV